MSTPTESGERGVKKIRAHLYISGNVQGVYFRQNTLIVSTSSGIMGWVRNLNDGRVEALFEGNERAVNKVIEWCHTGPPKAVVEYVNVEYEKYTGEFQDFRIN